MIPVDIDTTPIYGTVRDIKPIRVEVVDGTTWEPVWNNLMREYHYLGFRKMVGTRIKYLAFAGDRPIAAIGWRAAALKLKVRDCFIESSKERREEYLPRIANNNRFLILPWVHVRNLGSYLLSRIIRRLPTDWYEKYGSRLFLLETFVDPQRFQGTIYRAANWIYVGQTKGFTKQGPGYRYHGNKKEVYVYPLEPEFRDIIGCQPRERLPKEEGDAMVLQNNDWDPKLLGSGLTEEDVKHLAQLLVDFHGYFAECFNRCGQRRHGEVYLKGLMSDLERKSVEPIALRYLGEDGVRPLQRFLTDSTWDEERMLELHQTRLARLIATEDGMITVDSCEIPKKGKESVGVARQYCGNQGKVDNCQSGVFVGYSSSKGYGLIGRRLYMPEVWFSEEYKERREKCQVPENLRFMTKQEIALELIKQVKERGLFTAKWVGCDCTFGSDPKFRDALAAEGYWYFASIRSDTLVWRERPQIGLPEYKGRGRRPGKERPLTPPQSVSEVAKDPSIEWQSVILADGAKGPIVADVARVRVVECRDGLPHDDIWLFMRKNANGEIKFAFCNAPENIPFEEMTRASTMRWPVEQCFQEGKGDLGMDHYEVRSWRAWHRHMTYVFLAMLFLLEVRLGLKKTTCRF